MDSSYSGKDTGSVELPEAGLENLAAAVGEKRPVENGDDGELGVPPAKKARVGGGVVGNVKKVAEIVLVLAVMGKMRGGRSPTAAEKEMMAEAREKLSEVCEEFAPKDLFPRDAFGAVIEDLGLNKLREQRLGFRPPKMSIAEKMMLTKEKMEKSEELSSRTAIHSSQRLQMNIGAAAETRGASNTARMFPSDKPSHAPISSVGFQPASPLGHVSAANSASLSYQLPASEVKTTTVSSGLPASLLGRDSSSSALPRVERPNVRLDPRSNGSSYSSQIQVSSSGDHTLSKTPAWSQQSHSASSGKTGADNKMLPHPSVKVEGIPGGTTSRIAPQAATSKPLITQAASAHLPTMHQHGQGMHFVQASLLNNAHSEIGKIVQKLLQPHLPVHPTWTPPSRDYMNKALICQICKLIINEVENVLVCDSCEKGYHLKCLQSHNQKGVPRGEWHCFKCLSISNGKPLPPKYGRVTRNMNAPKVPSSTAPVQSAPEKKVGTLGEKGNQQKVTQVNGSSGLQSDPASSMSSNLNNSASGSITEMEGSDVISCREEIEDQRHLETCQNGKSVSELKGQSPAKLSETASMMPDHLQASSKTQDNDPKGPESIVLEGQSSAKLSETGLKTLDQSQASHKPHDNGLKGVPNHAGIPVVQCPDNKLTGKDSEKSHNSKSFDGHQHDENKNEEQAVVRADPAETSGTSIPASEHARSSSDDSIDVDWIGDVLQVVDEKTYYQSCCINGVVYHVQDHALFHSNNDKLMPSKLQSMWEDNKTRSKWVIVNRCYFAGDLPETVGRPCSPESNEVFESTYGTTIMAGLIQGPCEVLPPGKFIEETERRSRLGTEANGGSRPLFLCKWFYDESKGVFRDVSS